MWREAVRASQPAMSLVDLSTGRLIEVSPLAVALLGTTPELAPGLDYLSVAERPRDAAETLRLMREGTLDGLRGRRRIRRPDGSMVDVESSGWAIRAGSGPPLGLWAASEVPAEADRNPAAQGTISVLPSTDIPSGLDSARVTVDDRWRVAYIGTTAGSLLGRPPVELIGSSVIELTHPDDLAPMLLAFARATTQTSIGVWVRLRHHDGSWRAVRAAPRALGAGGEGTLPFALLLAADEEAEAPGSIGDAVRLAGHLRRIAAQIEAGVQVDIAHPLGALITSDLSPREWEVVSRLVRGDRVATIAAEMYLSASTVRNHLSAIFRKVGVHSQQELLARWRHGPEGPPT